MLSWARKPAETRCSCTPEAFIPAGDPDIIEEDGNAEVDDVCVIGVPHEILGELVCACIVPVEGAVITGEELKDFARDTMADYKIPDLVRFFDAFPMTGSGTVKRRELERTVALDPTLTSTTTGT